MLEDGAAHHLDIDRIQAALKATIESQAATIDSQAETMESMKELTDNDKRRNDRQNLVQEKKDRFKLLVSSAELAIILLFGGGLVANCCSVRRPGTSFSLCSRCSS